MTYDPRYRTEFLEDFSATPEELFSIWTSPEDMCCWLPGHLEGARTPAESITVDVSPGGSYRYTLLTKSGVTLEYGGVFREVDENIRLAFTWGKPGAHPATTPLVSVTFAAASGLETRIHLVVRGIKAFPGDSGAHDYWHGALTHMAQLVGSGADPANSE